MDNNQTGTRVESPQATREKIKNATLKGLAIVGIVALLALGTWGTVQILRSTPGIWNGLTAAVSSISGRFFPAGVPSLTLTLESYSVKSGESFTLAWREEEVPESREYAFVYECADALSFLTPNTVGGDTRIACGELYTFASEDRSLALTPISPDNRFLDATIKVLMVSGDQVVAEDEALLTIVNERITSTTTPPAPAPAPAAQPSAGNGASAGSAGIQYYPVYTTVTERRASDPNGDVDLAIEILETGTLPSRGDNFTSTGRTLDRDERGGVRFIVRNLGTKTAEDWTFEAELPTRPSFTYRSKSQPDLGPGDRIEFTLGFDRLSRDDEAEIAIEVDPRDNIDESSESNNRDEVTVEIE